MADPQTRKEIIAEILVPEEMTEVMNKIALKLDVPLKFSVTQRKDENIIEILNKKTNKIIKYISQIEALQLILKTGEILAILYNVKI